MFKYYSFRQTKPQSSLFFESLQTDLQTWQKSLNYQQ
jgi:hypothetical protein